jgi:tRNA(fMet)-specific endonuclease VapC
LGVILDTNALSAFANGDPAIGKRLSSVPVPSLPVVAIGEFRFGILGSEERSAYEKWLGANLDIFEILPVDAETAQRYAEIRHELRSRGTPIPSNDIWIAALSLQYRLPILSRDRHFSLIPGVRLIDW